MYIMAGIVGSFSYCLIDLTDLNVLLDEPSSNKKDVVKSKQ